MTGSVPSEALPLLFSLLIPLGCLAIRPPHPSISGHAFGSDYRAIAALLLPPSLYLLAGQLAADWPLARSQSAGDASPLALALVLGATLFVHSAGLGFRIQPLLAGITFLSVLVLPLGIAFERLLQSFPLASSTDVHHLGLIALASASFAMSARPKRDALQDPRAASPYGGLAFAWIAAALSRAPDPGGAMAALLVATGAALVASSCASIAASGVILPGHVPVAMLAGLIATIPSASDLAPRQGALVGLSGAALGLLARKALRTFSVRDEILVPAHLGGGIAGMLSLGFIQAHATRSPWPLAFASGLSLFLASASLLAGCAFWSVARLFARLDAQPDEMEIGLDLVEHGGSSADRTRLPADRRGDGADA